MVVVVVVVDMPQFQTLLPRFLGLKCGQTERPSPVYMGDEEEEEEPKTWSLAEDRMVGKRQEMDDYSSGNQLVDLMDWAMRKGNEQSLSD